MQESKKKVTALALFSGGLDSLLACRVVMEQGITVKAVKFVSPFFGYELLVREKEYAEEIYNKYGIDVILKDISEKYLTMLRHPPHGYGKNFNPCVDCKILLMQEAKEMMRDFDASFLISGEVIGQRPMSQRKDTLRVIELDGGCEGVLVRPLCAKNLESTKPELEGLIDREQLLDFRGRGRGPQMELAKKYGITDYPSPAGGCVLTDPALGKRIENFYKEHDVIKVADINLLMVGRHFQLPQGGWLTVGRKEAENRQVEALRQPDDWVLTMRDRPGPSAILRYSDDPQDIKSAASLVVRYGKKVASGPQEALVLAAKGDEEKTITAQPLEDELFQDWRR